MLEHEADGDDWWQTAMRAAQPPAPAPEPPPVSNVVAAVCSLRSLGLCISIENGTVRVSSASPLQAEHLALLRGHKAALVAIYEPPGACEHASTCLACGEPDTASVPLIGYGTGPLKWHLHARCWQGWFRGFFPAEFEPRHSRSHR